MSTQEHAVAHIMCTKQLLAAGQNTLLSRNQSSRNIIMQKHPEAAVVEITHTSAALVTRASLQTEVAHRGPPHLASLLAPLFDGCFLALDQV